MTDKADWKRKYLDTLDEQEAQNERWQSERHQLLRLIVRASLVAEGQDPGLDELLQALRDQAQAPEPSAEELVALQRRLDDRIARFDDRRDEAMASFRDAVKRIASNLRDRAEPDLRGTLRDFEKRALSSIRDFQSIPAFLHELARLQAMILHKEVDQPPRQGLWKRLFRSHDKIGSEHREIRGSVHDQVAETDLGAAVADEDLGELGSRLNRLLTLFVHQMPLSADARAQAENLQQRAARPMTMADVQELLDEVTQLVTVAFGHGRLEFEGFLATLDERLKRIQEEFREDLLDSDQWRRLSEDFDERMDEQLHGMTDLTEKATELRELKHAIAAEVTRLGDTVGQYREAERQREEHLEQQVSRLQEKVSAMETHAEGMQLELKKERDRASTDLLTQLPNREGLEERLAHEYARWQRYGHPVSLAMLDIDRFKDLNDTYGHLAGDKVLQLVARALRENLRQPDFVARYGGEEFVVLFPETSEEQALNVMDKAREHIAALPFHFRQEKVSVSFSAGVTEFRSVADPSQILDAADRALYQAKNDGRDRVCRATDAHWRPRGEDELRE